MCSEVQDGDDAFKIWEWLKNMHEMSVGICVVEHNSDIFKIFQKKTTRSRISICYLYRSRILKSKTVIQV